MGRFILFSSLVSFGSRLNSVFVLIPPPVPPLIDADSLLSLSLTSMLRNGEGRRRNLNRNVMSYRLIALLLPSAVLFLSVLFFPCFVLFAIWLVAASEGGLAWCWLRVCFSTH